MKKIISALLSLALALSIVTACFAASGKAEAPDSTPVVTLLPIDPDGPVDPPAQPMDDPPEPIQEVFED